MISYLDIQLITATYMIEFQKITSIGLKSGIIKESNVGIYTMLISWRIQAIISTEIEEKMVDVLEPKHV